MKKLEKENVSGKPDKDIFERMKIGHPIRLDDPQYSKIQEVVTRTIALSVQLNTSTITDQVRARLSQIIDTDLGTYRPIIWSE